MATVKQKAIDKNKEIEKRLAAVKAARTTRHKIYQAHGDFPEINSIIREIREGMTTDRK